MRDIENMKNPTKRMYDKFLNDFDKFIYHLVQNGFAFKVHGSIKEQGFQYSNVMLNDDMKKTYNIEPEYTHVIMQECSMGLINTYLVSSKPTGCYNEITSRHTTYKPEIEEE